VSDAGTPHAVHAPVDWDGEALVVTVGGRSARNAAARPSVSLLFPVRMEGDYTLIVDGAASVASAGEDHRLTMTPTKAVLHRHAVSSRPTATACVADCVPLVPGPATTPSRDR
jgi:hypothetical protein